MDVRDSLMTDARLKTVQRIAANLDSERVANPVFSAPRIR